MTETTAEMLRSVILKLRVSGKTLSTLAFSTQGFEVNREVMPLASTLSRVVPSGTAASSVISSAVI